MVHEIMALSCRGDDSDDNPKSSRSFENLKKRRGNGWTLHLFDLSTQKERRVRARIFLNVITRVQEKDASLQRLRKLFSQLDHQLLFSQPSSI